MTDTDESLGTILARAGTAPDYTMGAVGKQTEIAPETIRSWELRYGFPTPSRTPGNQRLYTARDIVALRWLQEQTRQGNSISSAIAGLKRALPDESPKAGNRAPSPMDQVKDALAAGDPSIVQDAWDDLALAVSPQAIGKTLLHLDTPALSPAAHAFLLRKATVLLDAAMPDTGSIPVAIATSGADESILPATVIAASLARTGHRILTPFPTIASLAGIRSIRDFGAEHVVIINPTEEDSTSLRAILPNVSLHTWASGDEIPDILTTPGE